MIRPPTFAPARSALSWATALVLGIAAACGEDNSSPKTGSNSNWLVACGDESDCASSGACLCGACSRECTDNLDCSSLEGARCSTVDEAARGTQCGGAEPSVGLCLPRCEPGSCDDGQSCVGGACVIAELPEAEFCDPARAASRAERAAEEQLLELIQQNRVAGSTPCTSGEALPPAAPLRLDGRLSCVARVRALDQQATGVTGPADSEGRNASERASLAGYDVSAWWESYAYNATNGSQAYDRNLADADSCPELGNPEYTDIGVGAAGDMFVVLLATR
ncbi:MAG TPA: hypothetical protein VFU02_06405 [Polyangiaceae bacterium]|nr:hypothetical protein [Polyangiaceae bacterium]